MRDFNWFYIIVAVIVIAALVFVGVRLASKGYNKQIFDFDYSFNYAIISNLDGTTTEGPIEKWNDYDDSDMVQVIFTDNTVYYTHGSNVILIRGD